MSDINKKDVLWYGDSRFDEKKIILDATKTFIKDSERISGPLLE